MIDVSLFTVKLVAALGPNDTAVAFVKPVPLMVNAAPPPTEPDAEDKPVTRGTGTNVGLHNKNALFDWLYSSLPFTSYATSVGSTVGDADSWETETNAPVKSHDADTHAEYVVLV